MCDWRWIRIVPWIYGKLWRIEANTKKIKVLLDISLPQKPKEVMSLVGKVAALIRFILQATDRCVAFFDVLKGSKSSNGLTSVRRHSRL